MLMATYYDSVMNNITWNIATRDVDDNIIASNTTFNFSTSYRGEMSNGMQWRAAMNVTNLFNREPSIVAGAGGQSIIAGHDALGRRYQFSLNMDF
jgi:outer membrane receptor protein involved in Fe transport